MAIAINFRSGPALGAIFLALASSAILLTRLDGGIALLWVANAPLLMGLCRTDVRAWWRLMVWVAPAAVGASILFGPVAWAAPFLAVASLVEALLAAILLRRLAVDCDYFRSGRSVLLFAVIAGLAAPMAGGLIAASVAAASLHRGWAGIYLDWVLGHGLGMLIGSPVMLLLADSRRSWLTRSTRVDRPGVAALALVGVTAAGVFSQERLPLLFLPALPILLATFRLGRAGATVAMMLVALIGAGATMLGHGPIVMTHLSHVGQLQFFQVYLVATFAMSLPVASALEQVRLALARTRETNRLFGMAGEIASIGYWRWDVRSNVITWSDEVFRIFGITVGQVPSLPDILGFYHPDDRARVVALLETVQRDGVELDYAARLVRADGEVRHVLAYGQVEFDGDGGVAALFGVFQDVTARARAEQTMRESEIRLRAITEQANDMIALLDLRGTCLFMSPAAASVLGVPAEALIGTQPLERVHPDDREDARRFGAGLAVNRRNGSATLRFRMLRSDGAYAWLEASARIARIGERTCIVTIWRDVSRQVAIESELRAARTQAEAASSAKADFLANMSHEIRTPMNGVIGFAELLLASDLTDEQRRDAGMIADSGRTMMKLLGDILDLSKIEAGQLDVVAEPYDLPHALRACGKLMAPSLAQKSLSFTFELADDVPATVSGDALRVRQIVLNLIGNAIKFTGEGGITLSGRRVSTDEGEHLAIAVADTGIGIPADRQSSIFEDFVQADDTITRRYGGTGLGLAISSRLAALMGGRITLESEVGVGTVVTLLLPATVATGVERPSPQPATPARTVHPVAILLAEDNEVNQLLVRSMLERDGHHVTIVGDGQAAVATVAQAPDRFDLVLMDMQMPILDGLAATRAIRAAEGPGRHIPIIALTANAFAADLEACRDAGMDAHVAKPVSMEALRGAVARQMPMTASGSQAQPSRPAFKPSAVAAGKYAAQRAAALDEIDALVRRGTMTDLELETVAGLLHKLAGTAGMFGEHQLGNIAAEIEEEMGSWRADDRLDRARAAHKRIQAAA